ncbi:MAG: MerR family transcriptional regulator [Solirubrobacteraceae bacterium]|nr:MerR family transcriptional regulator [Solirubrobacteraceae bacterium]
MPGALSMTLAEVAAAAGTTPGTVRRWVQAGLVPQYPGAPAPWSGQAAAHVRIIARLRDRGHTIAEIREASDSGRLAFGFVQELFPHHEGRYTLEEAAELTGLEPALIDRFYKTVGLGEAAPEHLHEDDLALLRDAAAVLEAGFPFVAFMQLARVYGQAIAQMADASVRLVHLYVHEPLMRDGIDSVEMAEQMTNLTRQVLPLAAPLTERLHQRFLQHFVEQDVVGHMELDLDQSGELGRMRVAIAFADLAGYTRMTEELGDAEAAGVVERFIDRVEATLPENARVIKTIGDEVMIVGSDATALTAWAVRFQAAEVQRPRPRIGVHCGDVVYRDGDYYGREVNQAARVVARAGAGEVLVTGAVVDAVGDVLRFEPIGAVKLKGFADATELSLASSARSGP